MNVTLRLKDEVSLLYPLIPTTLQTPGHGGKPTSYGGEDHVRKFHQEDFQDEDDDKKKSAYNGNSVQQQWTVVAAASIITVWMVLK